VVNPVPRVPHPEWLWKKIREKDDKYQQRSLKDMFGPKVLPVHNQHLESELAGDVEDMVGTKVNSLGGGPRPMIHTFETNKEVRFPISPNSESGMANQPQPQKTTKVRTPDRNVDYSAWLEHKKRKWKEIRENRKRSRCACTLLYNWMLVFYHIFSIYFHLQFVYLISQDFSSILPAWLMRLD
jgi:DNA polymerase epsilon subunit 1